MLISYGMTSKITTQLDAAQLELSPNLINFVEGAKNKKRTAALDILRPRKFHFLKLMSD